MTNDRTGTDFLIDTYESGDPVKQALLTYALADVVNALDKVYGNITWRSGFHIVQVVTFDSILGRERDYENTLVMGSGVL